jgi:hypothetical protein
VQTTLQKRSCAPFRWQLENFEGKRDAGYKHSALGGCQRALSTTVQALSGCAIAPAHPLRWTGCAKRKQLVYRCGKQRSEPTSDKRGAKVDELHLTPLELIDRIAALVPRHAPTGTATLACWHPTRRSGLR